MSFDLFVFDGVDLPGDADAITALLEERCPSGTTLTPSLASLVAHLAARFPGDADGVSDGPEGAAARTSSPWASWPLGEPLVGGRAVAVNLVWSADEAVLDELVDACRERSLTLYDPQAFTVTKLEPPPADTRRLWWQRRRR